VVQQTTRPSSGGRSIPGIPWLAPPPLGLLAVCSRGRRSLQLAICSALANSATAAVVGLVPMLYDFPPFPPSPLRFCLQERLPPRAAKTTGRFSSFILHGCHGAYSSPSPGGREDRFLALRARDRGQDPPALSIPQADGGRRAAAALADRLKRRIHSPRIPPAVEVVPVVQVYAADAGGSAGRRVRRRSAVTPWRRSPSPAARL